MLADWRRVGRQPGVIPVVPVAAESSKRLLPWLVAVAFFMEQLDTTILNTAVPTIAAALRVAPLSMKAVLSSYTLAVAVFIPLSGWVADRFGTRRVFASAIGLFTLGSILCGISRDVHVLVACRILQGSGGAMMVPVGRLTLVRTFDKSELVRAMSFVAIPSLIGPMLGPVVGGFFVAFLHWRWVFFVNVPMGLIGLYMVDRHLPDYREPVARLDVLGVVLFGSGIALLSYVLEVFGEHTLSPVAVVGLLVVSVVLLVMYGIHASRSTHPLVYLGLFRIRTFRSAVVGSLITRLAVSGMPFLLPLLYQIGLGYTPLQSGLLISPQSLAAIVLKVAMPRILTFFGYRQVLLLNTIAIGCVIALFATIGLGAPWWLIVAYGALFGFFSSLQFTSMNTLVYADVAQDQTSQASTIASTVQQMSMSFGVATASLVAAFFVPDRHHATPAQLIAGIHEAFLVLGAVTVLSVVVFLELRPTDGENISRHGDGEPGRLPVAAENA